MLQNHCILLNNKIVLVKTQQTGKCTKFHDKDKNQTKQQYFGKSKAKLQYRDKDLDDIKI